MIEGVLGELELEDLKAIAAPPKADEERKSMWREAARWMRASRSRTRKVLRG